MKRKNVRNDSPFATWLVEQADKHDITLTELCRRAGLSSGTLRGIIATPNRQPTVDTCLRLARALDLSYEQVFEVAGFSPSLPDNPNLVDPDRIEFVQLYDQLPAPARRTLLDTAKVLSSYLDSVTA